MIDRVSYSVLRDYLECPLLFLYRHVLKLELPEKPIHLHFGKALHRALELQQKENADPIAIFQKEFTSDLIAREDLSTYLALIDVGVNLLKYNKANPLEFKIAKIRGLIK